MKNARKNDDIGFYLRFFFTDYLPRQRNAGSNTIHAYRDAIRLLLLFVATAQDVSVAELELCNIDRPAVLSFLEFIERDRGNQVSTRNQRLSAIRSFFRCISYSSPESVEQCRAILSIPIKRGNSAVVDYLTIEEMKAVLSQVSNGTANGRRDHALLWFLYNTGARVQEAIDVRAMDLRLEEPAHVRLFGKGRKERICPLWSETAMELRSLLEEHGIEAASPSKIFVNREGKALTRFGVRYILSKYAQRSERVCSTIEAKKVHPHTIRHTTAMHLLQAGVDLNTIRCWLGHVSVTTTNRYVEIDLEMKRRAIETITPSDEARQHGSSIEEGLMEWLESL